MNQSVKLAQLWLGLDEIKTSLDNEVIPLSFHLKAVDSDLIAAMEKLSEAIGSHFQRFHLTMQSTRKKE